GGDKSCADAFDQSQAGCEREHLIVRLVHAAFERQRNGLRWSLSAIRIEKRADGGAAGGIAIFHSTHSVAHHGEKSAVLDKRFVIRIREAERILLRMTRPDMLRVAWQESHQDSDQLYLSPQNGISASLVWPISTISSAFI